MKLHDCIYLICLLSLCFLSYDEVQFQEPLVLEMGYDLLSFPQSVAVDQILVANECDEVSMYPKSFSFPLSYIV